MPQIATLETGVLNIKSVLTRNTDPGLIAMTGVINLLVRRSPGHCWGAPVGWGLLLAAAAACVATAAAG